MLICRKANAKINLSIDVLNKRDDGYHNVKMIMTSVDLCDKINIYKENKGITIKTNKYYLPVDMRNTAYKAADLFFKRAKINGGAYIKIKKNIFVGAGLAGGSSNAAAVLLGLNELYGFPIDRTELTEIGKEIGADVPYCMMGGTCLAEGIGDILTPLPSLPKMPILLVKPQFSVSTPAIYSKLKVKEINERPDTDGLIKALETEDFMGAIRRGYNVLEDITSSLFPLIKEIKRDMIEYGALSAMMSGSGPTVFGFFKDDEIKAAEKHFKELKYEVYSGYIVSNKQ